MCKQPGTEIAHNQFVLDLEISLLHRMYFVPHNTSSSSVPLSGSHMFHIIPSSESSCWHETDQMSQCPTPLLTCRLYVNTPWTQICQTCHGFPRVQIWKLERSVCFPLCGFPAFCSLYLLSTYFCLYLIRSSSFVRHSFLIWPQGHAGFWVVFHHLFSALFQLTHTFYLSIIFLLSSLCEWEWSRSVVSDSLRPHGL